MARARFVGVVGIVAVAVAGLSACGSSSSSPAAASTSPAVTAEPTTAAVATTPDAAAASSSAPAVTSASTTSSAHAGAAAAPAPAKVVADAWLPASQFPLVGKLPWQLDPNHSATAGVAVDTEMDEQAPYYRCQPEQLGRIGVGAIQSRDYRLDPAPSPDDKQVQQLQLFFTDQTAAAKGLATIQGWQTGCTGGTAKQTASGIGGAAYVVTASSGTPVYHEYFVQRGAVIDSVVITGNGAAAAAVKDAGQDQATLAAMATRLCTYGQSAC